MSCPFLDPAMLARIPPQKREEMKELYHKMKTEEVDHLKIDIKEENFTDGKIKDEKNVSDINKNQEITSTSSKCPYQSTLSDSGNGEQQIKTNQSEEQSQQIQTDIAQMIEDDPQSYLEMLNSKASEGSGGGCPFMGSKFFDPFNQKYEFGYPCFYKSKWAFLLSNKGRLSTRNFLSKRKMFEKLPYAIKHSLFHPDDLKKIRDKSFSGLFFHFEKNREEANKLFKEGEYFEALEYYEQILSVFKWLEFTDKEKQEDFFKNLKMDPILDIDVKLNEKDLGDDECEIELRSNLVVTLLLNIGYCYMKLFFYDEAKKCFDMAADLAPIASDAYLRRSQLVMYNKNSSMEDYKLGVEDVNKALQKRPKDKFYLQHKEELMQTLQSTIFQKVKFIKELIEKAHYQITLKERMRRNRQKVLEENKEAAICQDTNEQQEEEFQYPEECKVIDIMKDKYFDAIAFFHETDDKTQLKLSVKEFQRFSFFYQKMSNYLEFDPQSIEEDIYTRLDQDTKAALSNPIIIKEINRIRMKKASKILEDEDVHILNFEMFQYALKILHREKKKVAKAEEEMKIKEEERLNGGKVQTKKGSYTKLIFANLIFFMVVASGILWISGNQSVFSMFGQIMGQNKNSTQNKDLSDGF